MIIRIGKIVILLNISAFFCFVFLGNLMDYQSNFDFVKHVLSMDTTFLSPNLMWRAICNPMLHHMTYALIIVWQAATAILCFVGSLKLIRFRSSPSVIFNSAKGLGVIGLICGFLLYSFAFIIIGGEWFAM